MMRRVGLVLGFMLLFVSMTGVAAQGHWLTTKIIGEGKAHMAAWHPDGEFFAIASDTGVRVYDLELNQIAYIYDRPVTALAWQSGGTLAMVTDEGIALMGADDVADARLWEVIPHGEAPLAWSPDGRYLAYSSRGIIRIWDYVSLRTPIAFGEHAKDASYGTPRIEQLAWSPDGTRIASVGSPDELLIWDVATGTVEQHLADYLGSSTAELHWFGDSLWAFDPYDGETGMRYILTNDTITELFVSEQHYGYAGAYKPDGSLLVVMDGSQELKVLDASQKNLTTSAVLHFSGEKYYPTTLESGGFLAWREDGKYLISLSEATVVLWQVDGEQFERVGHLTAYNGNMSGLALSPDGAQLATTSGVWSWYTGDSRVRVWNVETGGLIWRSEWEHGAKIKLDWRDDGRYIATTLKDDECATKVWDAEKHTLAGCFIGASFSYDADWRPAAETFVTIYGNGLFEFAPDDVPTDDTMPAPYLFPDGSGAFYSMITEMDWSPDGKLIASDGYPEHENGVSVWRYADGKLLAELEDSTGFVTSVQRYPSADSHIRFSPDGTLIAVAEGNASAGLTDFSRVIGIYDAQTGKRLQTLQGHRGGVVSIEWSADGERLLSASLDGTVRVWYINESDNPTEIVLNLGDTEPLAGAVWLNEYTVFVGTHAGLIYRLQNNVG